MSYKLKRGRSKSTPKGNRWGVWKVIDSAGKQVKTFIYHIGNLLSRRKAKREAEDWINENNDTSK